MRERHLDTVTEEGTRHLVYLLRCWRETSNGEISTWRFRVEGMSPGEQYGFGSLDDLVRFLRRRFKGHDREEE